MARRQGIGLPGKNEFKYFDSLITVRAPELLVLLPVGGDAAEPLEAGARHQIQPPLFEEAQNAEIQTLLRAELLDDAFEDRNEVVERLPALIYDAGKRSEISTETE